MLTTNDFSPRDLSELAAQMGTMEFNDGSRKQALRFMKQGAENPTENAVAQIEWVARKRGAFQTDELLLDVSQSHEASAYSEFEKSNWDASLAHCEAWHEIEPFSARPAIFGSYVASISRTSLERGIRLAQQGLTANPKDATLLNNIAVLHAYLGEFDIADRELARAQTADADGDDRVTLLATKGLILLRRGSWEDGISMYSAAIDEAIRIKNGGLALRAYCFLGREVSIIDGQMASQFLEQIDGVLSRSRGKGWRIPTDILYLRDQIDLAKVEADRTSLSVFPNIDWDALLQSALE